MSRLDRQARFWLRVALFTQDHGWTRGARVASWRFNAVADRILVRELAPPCSFCRTEIACIKHYPGQSF